MVQSIWLTLCVCLVNSLSLKNTSSFELTHDNLMHVPGIEFRWDYILIYVLLWCMQGGGFGKKINFMRTYVNIKLYLIES